MFKVRINEMPSLQKEPKITTIIKENPYKNNVEIEKDELVIRPDLAAIYKAKGEKHSNGGIKTYLPDNSFVISDDKSLALSKDEQNLLELKEGGPINKSKNTPADVLKRNIDVEHYNKMSAILGDNKKDEFSKRTAAMMLGKYEDILGRVAYAQEAKKGFPNGLPEFSQDAAPVLAENLKQTIQQQPQFMKKGGYKNPYMKMDDGGPYRSKYRDIQESLNNKNVNTYVNNENFNPYVNNVLNTAMFGQQQPISDSIQTNNPTQNRVLSPNQKPNILDDKNSNIASRTKNPQQVYDETMLGYLLQNGETSVIPSYMKGNPFQEISSSQHKLSDGTYGQGNYDTEDFKLRHDWYFKDKPNFDFKNKKDVLDFQNQYNSLSNQITGKDYFGIDNGFRGKDGLFGEYTNAAPNIFNKKRQEEPTISTKKDLSVQAPTVLPNNPINPINPSIIGEQKTKKQQPWEFSKWQKADMAVSALDMASVRRDFPYRSQIKSPLVEMNELNPQAALNNVDNSVYGNRLSNRGLNPYMAGANDASTFGKGLDGKNQVQGQYDNQNIGINNQQNQINNQTQAANAGFNTQADQQYYKESVRGRENFDNMKQTARNKFREIVNGNVQANQVLQYNMMSQNNPAFSYDYKEGNFNLTGKNPFDVQTQSTGNDFTSQYQQMMLNKMHNGSKLTMEEASIMNNIYRESEKNKRFMMTRKAKLGGKMNPYK